MIKVKILKEDKYPSPLEDFLVEMSFWQKWGIGNNLIRDDLVNKFNNARIVPVHHSSLLDVSNCFNNWFGGESEDELFESMFEAYERTKRGPMETRGNNSEEKRSFLKKLLETVKNGTCNEPNIVQVPQVGRFIAGGKTRIALAKVANIPINAKLIMLKQEDVDNREKALEALIKNFYKKGE